MDLLREWTPYTWEDDHYNWISMHLRSWQLLELRCSANVEDFVNYTQCKNIPWGVSHFSRVLATLTSSSGLS